MNPASTIKLVTTAAAMDLLGSDYRPVTRFYALGPVQKGVLKAGLGILGGGDPKLVIEDLQLVIAELKAKGVRRIEGRFVLDGSRYHGLDTLQPVTRAYFTHQDVEFAHCCFPLSSPGMLV